MKRRVLMMLVVPAALASWLATSAGGPPAGMVGNAFSPARRDPTDARIAALRVPPGFQVGVFARDVHDARMMAIGPDGTVYVTRPGHDDVVALRDRDRDGRADDMTTVLSDVDKAHGITIHDGRMYVAGVHKVLAADVRADGTLGSWATLIDDLPAGGQHENRTLGIGPDGMLYISVGSTCNDCIEADPEHATILRAERDGRSRTVLARGLRNTIGFGWHPGDGVWWGMDHGSDWRGDDEPAEELNRLGPGDYGWPYCIGDRRPDPFSKAPPGTTKEAYCARTIAPTLTYQAHSAPIALVFYAGAQYPAEYAGDAFVAMHGSWNRKPATGYKVVRLRFDHGTPVRFEDFLTGFLVEDGAAYFGRPAGLAVDATGALLVSDDSQGIIYRVVYRAGR